MQYTFLFSKHGLAARLILLTAILVSAPWAAGVTPAQAGYNAAPAHAVDLAGNPDTIHPSPAGASSPFPVVSAGEYHTCGRTVSGAVKCWGVNDGGQLGDGTTTIRYLPVDVIGLSSGVKAVSVSSYHSCALTNGGAVKCWGYNEFGQLGDGTTDNRFTPVNVSGLSSGVKAISSGSFHTCALTNAGGVKCWGKNTEGQLGNGTTTDSSTPVSVEGLSGVIAISASATSRHTCALTSARAVKCWGFNHKGQLGDGTTDNRSTPVDVIDGAGGFLSGMKAIAAGGWFTCALTTSGEVKCWGYNLNGQLGNNSIIDSHTPVDVVDGAGGYLSGMTAIAAGSAHTCAITDYGALMCWGKNDYSQLGDDTEINKKTPVSAIWFTSGVKTVITGGLHTCVVNNGGTLKCWGYNGEGQLGNGDVGVVDPVHEPVYMGKPVSLSPTDGITLAQGKSSVTLKWKQPVFAGKKQISGYRVGAESTNANYLGFDTIKGGTSMAMKNLMPNSDYTWIVQAKFKDGSSGNLVSSTIHTIKTKPPKLGAPGINSKQTKPMVKFTWSKPAGTPKTGFQYELQYGTNPAFDDDGSLTQYVPDLVKTFTSVPLPINDPVKTIYWRVIVRRAIPGGDYSDYSASKYFLR